MEDFNNLRKMVAANLRSVTQSCKGGVPIESLERDYRDLLGVSIPYKKLGYFSLEAMIRAMPDVVKLQKNASGKTVVMAVANQATAHIASLIARQRSAVKKPVARYRRPLKTRRTSATEEPPSVRLFNKGTRAPPSYLEEDFRAHSKSSSRDDHIQEAARSAMLREQVHSKKSKAAAAAAASFGPKFEVPPRFLRKQERPLSSLENNSIEERVSTGRQVTSGRGSAATCLSQDDTGFVPPRTKRSERITYTNEPRSAREYVEHYARQNSLKLNYQTAPIGQRKKSFVSVLTLGEERYRNYPEYAATSEAAENAAAEKARQAIIHQEGSQKLVPVADVDDPWCLERMLTGIDEIVAEKPKGIWNTVIPTEYEAKFEERLPDSWFALVKEHCSFYFEKVDDNRIILYPGSGSGRISPTSTSSTQDDESSEDLERRLVRLSVEIPMLPFPKTNPFDVFVCSVQDAQYVAVRFLDYADCFEDLSDKMKEFYAVNKCPVHNISVDKPYAVYDCELWHRALIDEIKDDMVVCQLVDEGDSIQVSINSLQELDPKFLELPFQAYTFKLAELGSYSTYVKPETLQTYLLGKPLVAEVVNNSRTSIILYDTQTDEDINLNRIIFEKTVAETLAYKLPPCNFSAVAYLSHVSPCGTIYLTFNSPSTTNLLLEELWRITPICEENSKKDQLVLQECIYCARYNSDSIWYRAIILDSTPEKDKVEVLYVDYGNTSWVPVTSICPLKPVSQYLAELPFQAVRCKLSELPPRNLYWNDNATQKLVEMAPDEKELIVRVQDTGAGNELPEVSLFVRNEQSQIISINQTLAFTEHLFSLVPSGKRDRLPSWTKGFLPEFNKTEYTPPASSSGRVHNVQEVQSPAAVGGTITTEQENLSNSIPDVAVSAEQQLAKRHGNRGVACLAVTNECENEEEQFPPLYPPDVPDEKHYFDVFVTMAASPYNFMCQPLKSSKDLDRLFSDMQSFYSCEENLCEMHSVLVKKGEFFAGKHVDGSWYRIRKQSIVSEDPLEVSVYYVDYGDICILGLPNLQPLFKQFKSLPCQSMKASLTGVRPNGHDWDPMECFEFKKMVEEKQFVSTVKNKHLKVEDHMTVYCLELELVDVSDPDVDIYIHEELIKNKLAQPA